MKKVSIALCTYNGAEYLPAQLASFTTQTRLPDEIVVCDDCSTDETAEIIENFARSAAFPVHFFVNEKNLGSTKNFERAVSLCDGEVIFLADQDDVWMPHKLARIGREFENSEEVGLVFTDAELVDENLRSLGINLWKVSFTPKEQEKALRGEFLEVLLRRNVVTGATAAFRADLREHILPIPTHLPNIIHDGWLALIAAAMTKISFIEEPLIKYRQHEKQQLGIDWSGKHLKIAAANQITIAEANQISYEKSIALYQRELERLSLMNDILISSPIFAAHCPLTKDIEENCDELREIILHYTVRKDLPKHRAKRLAPVYGEISSGRYKRFSRGIFSAIKDLMTNI